MALTRWRRIAFATAATLGFFAVIEGALRFVVAKEVLLFAWERPNGPAAFEASGALVGPPNSSFFAQDGPYRVDYKTNSAGFRESTETPIRKPAGTTRYLAVGDSWIWGTSVTQGKTLPDRLEVHLTERLGHPVLVEDAGIQGMSAFDMYMAFRRYAANYEFDGVLIGKPHNETREDDVAERRRAFFETATPFPTSDWRLYLLLRRYLYQARMPAVPVGVDDETNDSPLVRGAITDIIRLVREARAAGLPAYFLDFPNTWRIQGTPGAEYASSPPWVAALSAEGVPYAGHAMTERMCWGFRDLDHPSEAGADALAVVIAELIVTGETLPRRATTPTCAESVGTAPGKPGAPE